LTERCGGSSLKKVLKMNDKTERVKEYFEDNPWDVTAVIDSINSPAWRYIYLERVKSIFEMLQLQPNENMILEVGCGSGWAHLKYSPLTESGSKIIASDISKAMIKRAKYYAERENRSVDYLTSDGQNLPFKEGSFDAAFCIGTLHHVEYPQKMIKEMARVARKVCCAEPNYLNPKRRIMERKEYAKERGETSFLMHKLKRMFLNANLKSIKIKRINCILPSIEGTLFRLIAKIEPALCKIPILNLISRYLVIYGER